MTFTPLPTLTPVDAGTTQTGENRGEIPIGGGDLWLYEGQVGEVLTVRVNADNPAGFFTLDERTRWGLLDTYVILRDPDGNILVEGDDIDAGGLERTNSMIEYVLPTDGVYQIEVRSYADQSGGAYTLVIESQLSATATPPPRLTLSLTPSPTDTFTPTPSD